MKSIYKDISGCWENSTTLQQCSTTLTTKTEEKKDSSRDTHHLNDKEPTASLETESHKKDSNEKTGKQNYEKTTKNEQLTLTEVMHIRAVLSGARLEVRSQF